jgi:hypothetical protein
MQFKPQRYILRKQPGRFFDAFVFLRRVGNAAKDKSFSVGKDIEDRNEE